MPDTNAACCSRAAKGVTGIPHLGFGRAGLDPPALATRPEECPSVVRNMAKMPYRCTTQLIDNLLR